MKGKMDRARQKTDKILSDIEQTIVDIYINDVQLKRLGEKYRAYMDLVDNQSILLRNAFLAEDDKTLKQEAKRAYMRKIEGYTIHSAEYNKIVRDFTRRLAEVNQKALDVINDRMAEIYMINYNQVAEECEKVGIRVINGEET